LTGLIVFERFSGGVRPTQAGQEFLRNARSILEQVDALAAAAHSTGRGEAGRLAIGFCTSLSAGNLRATLADVAQRFPQLEIELIESSRKRIATALRNGGVDIAIVPGAAPLTESTVLALWSERILVAIPEGHPFADRQAVYWIDLKDETVLLSRRDPGPELNDLAEPLEAHGAKVGAVRSAVDLEDAVGNADYIQSVPERLEIKREFYQRVDALLGAETIVGSSTSGFPASSFTESLNHRERCMVAHPINPPHLIPPRALDRPEGREGCQ
jgi:DNA-binding transcriptional LysR family regulator